MTKVLRDYSNVVNTCKSTEQNWTFESFEQNGRDLLMKQSCLIIMANCVLLRFIHNRNVLINKGKKTNDLILNLTPENMTQHSRIE